MSVEEAGGGGGAKLPGPLTSSRRRSIAGGRGKGRSRTWDRTPRVGVRLAHSSRRVRANAEEMLGPDAGHHSDRARRQDRSTGLQSRRRRTSPRNYLALAGSIETAAAWRWRSTEGGMDI